MSFEFIEYVPTPGEKHLGIAKVKCWGRIVLRYKIVPTKDGSGYFPVPASYKLVENGTDRYVPAFILDSNSDKEDLEGLIKSNVKKFMSPSASSSSIPYPALSYGTSQDKMHQEDNLPF